ncbi:MAG: CoA transferase [Thermoleophilaceae bacterium]
MARPESHDPPLHGVRVVELSDGIAASYSGWLLATLGADVVKLEPPDGDRIRRWGPRPPGAQDDDGGLFVALNRGKRSVVQDLETDEGRRVAFEIVASRDVFLTDLPIDQREARGLGHSTLSSSNGRLVSVGVSPYGDEGPLAGTAGCGLTTAAFAGASTVIGLPERSPLAPPFDLLDYEAGANAAAAALAAVLTVERDGEGQRVDVAAVEVAASFVTTNALMYVPCGKPWARDGRRASKSGGAYPYGIYPCRDGYITMIGRSRADWERIVEAMGWPAWSRDPRFEDPFVIADEHADEVDEHMSEWLARHTKGELARIAREHKVVLAPLRTVEDVLADPHFEHRGVFEHKIRVGDRAFSPPRPPWDAGMSAGRLSPAPRLGEHTDEIGSAVGPPARNGRSTARASGDGPLAGLRVVDFSWVWSGPMVGATLADLGAEVIKIEHRGRLDNARLRCRPLVDGKPLEGPLEELSYYFRQNNRGKRSLTVDLKHPRGLEVVTELVAQSDVVLENLTRGVFPRIGLDLDAIRRRNPALIVLSMSAAGEDGPMRGLRAYAPVMTALSGLESMVGYDDEPSLGMMTLALGDPNAASHALVAVLAALVGRARTGLGRQLDVPQVEAMLTPLMEAIAEFQLAGRDPAQRGMRHPEYVPHGHYPCQADDSWVAIAVDSAASWGQLVEALAIDELRDDRFLDATARREAAATIDAALAATTRQWDRDELVELLVACGVAAAPVHRLDEVLANRHLRERGLYVELEHPLTGRHEVSRVPWRLERTPAAPRTSAPLVGEHTHQVLADHLGLGEAEIAELERSGALSS